MNDVYLHILAQLDATLLRQHCSRVLDDELAQVRSNVHELVTAFEKLQEVREAVAKLEHGRLRTTRSSSLMATVEQTKELNCHLAQRILGLYHAVEPSSSASAIPHEPATTRKRRRQDANSHEDETHTSKPTTETMKPWDLLDNIDEKEVLMLDLCTPAESTLAQAVENQVLPVIATVVSPTEDEPAPESVTEDEQAPEPVAVSSPLDDIQKAIASVLPEAQQLAVPHQRLYFDKFTAVLGRVHDIVARVPEFSIQDIPRLQSFGLDSLLDAVRQMIGRRLSNPQVAKLVIDVHSNIHRSRVAHTASNMLQRHLTKFGKLISTIQKIHGKQFIESSSRKRTAATTTTAEDPKLAAKITKWYKRLATSQMEAERLTQTSNVLTLQDLSLQIELVCNLLRDAVQELYKDHRQACEQVVAATVRLCEQPSSPKIKIRDYLAKIDKLVKAIQTFPSGVHTAAFLHLGDRLAVARARLSTQEPPSPVSASALKGMPTPTKATKGAERLRVQIETDISSAVAAMDSWGTDVVPLEEFDKAMLSVDRARKTDSQYSHTDGINRCIQMLVERLPAITNEAHRGIRAVTLETWLQDPRSLRKNVHRVSRNASGKNGRKRR